MIYPAKIIISIFPVFLFLAALIFLDSYKLVGVTKIIRAIAYGCLVALICYYLHRALIDLLNIKTVTYTRYISPFIEEILKGLWIVQLLKRNKIGFVVDASILGFAIGSGFAFVENSYFVFTLHDSQVLVWILRGFGTAIMHGGAQAVFAALYQTIYEKIKYGHTLGFGLTILTAVAIHSAYNHFLLSPVLSAIILIIFLPVIFMIAFEISERTTRNWLGSGLDTDIELMDIIESGIATNTRVGQYFEELQSKFPGPVVADMLCYLRLHIELSMRAKGIMLARQHGLQVTCEYDIEAKFKELEFLKKSIGKTGRIALLPLLRTSNRDLWQIHMLKGQKIN